MNRPNPLGLAIVALLVSGCAGATTTSLPAISPVPSGTAATLESSGRPTSSEIPATPIATGGSPPTLPEAPAPTELAVDHFAEVVADQVVVRRAPGLESDALMVPCYDSPGPCPTMVIGAESRWTAVYVLDGPVRADGYEWYLVAIEGEGTLYWEAIGWVAAGDAEDGWVVRRERPCPAEPVELEDITFAAISPLTALHCFGGRSLTMRGYYTDPPPGEPTNGDCVGEPAWLVCTFGGHIIRTEPGTWAGDANHLELHLHPDVGPMPPRPGWIEVTGQFDHSAAAECHDGRPGSDVGCRVSFVVTSARGL